jgi:class 3 adenylate cyclase
MNTTTAAANLASVVFLKIQEFARRPAQEQARMRAQLDAVLAVTAAELEPAGWIALDAADGVAVAVLDDPEGAMRLAQRALTAAAAGLPLCVGINHGAVQVSSGGRGGDGLIGDGIAVAASVAEFASSTRVLISRSFRDALAEAAPRLDSGLQPAGVFTDAGLRTHELFYPDKQAVGRRQRRILAAGIAIAVMLVGGGIAARAATGGHQKVLDATMGKVGMSAKQREAWLRGVREKVRF